MIYPADFETKIGFDILRKLLKDNCLSPLGEARCEQMSFSSNFDNVRRLLSQTAEMLSLINGGQELPSSHFYDVTASLKSIQTQGNFLAPAELYRVRMSLQAIAQVRDFFARSDSEGHSVAPVLSTLFADMALFPQLIQAIDKAVNKFGEVADNASPELYDIRRRIAASSASLSSLMQCIVSRGVAEGYLDKDTAPSMRDGRLVIPVSAAQKRSIPGIVHDESATGKTSYIEPAEVVEASNRLRELRESEKREVHRILVALADVLRPQVAAMLQSYSMLGVYDFIRAKALVAREFDANMPVLEKKPELDWYGAIHPVLEMSLRQQGRAVVPLTLRLDAEHRILIISGPNAGGKSVCLKTAGIVQYMLQCGMLPTMHANSHACVFNDILIDIGDEQSLENDLSTYSSHLRNMKVFLRNSSPRTFILIDEMGSGTEPQIGGALAQALLKQMNAAKVMGIVTTHYQNLKTFADSEPGLINGAMLYDRQHMQPLFKLSIGNPGSSFALEIANKIGLPHSVIEDARNIVGSDYVNMDKYLLDIARDRRYWTEKRRQIKEQEHKLENLLERLHRQQEEMKAKKQSIMADARRQAAELLADSNAKLERTILEIRTTQAEKERTKQVRRELEEYKTKLAKTEQKSDAEIPELPKLPKQKSKHPEGKNTTPAPSKDKELAVGDYVRMSAGGIVGRILSITGTQAEVAFGAMRTRVPLVKLSRAVKPQTTAATQTASVTRTTTDESRKRQLNFKQEIDLRGMRVDEAIQAVAYFLDDAVQFEILKVRILHGTGTGALRMAIRQYLQTNPDVRSFHDEDVRFGGAGITVVNL